MQIGLDFSILLIVQIKLCNFSTQLIFENAFDF